MGDLVLFAVEEVTQDLSIFAPVSPPAENIRSLSLLVFAITGFIFVVVEGVLIYCIWRFWRRDAGAKDAGTQNANVQDEPPQVYGSKPIEIAWTAAPAMIVFILMLVITRTLWQVERPQPQPAAGDHALFVTVVGHQWWWEYQYEHYDGRKLGFITANELHVPAGADGSPRPVYLTLKSADVCHSFWVPRLAGKTDLIPGHTNTAWFQTDKPGLYVGQCAEYCGTQHANMLLRVMIDPADEFDKWLDHEAAEAEKHPAARDEEQVFLGLSCVNCHRVRGTPARGVFGPDLTHFANRETLAAGMLPNTLENLRAWLADPQKVKPGCLMPAFGLTEQQRGAVLRYLSSLQ